MTQAQRSYFHFAFHVTDLERARAFYVETLGCTQGRASATWQDVSFFGHQLSLHLGKPFHVENSGRVDGKAVPMPHFGVIVQQADFQALAQRLSDAGVAFILPPQLRFQGQAGEQWTMFFTDPFGNPIEVKGFVDLDTIFEH